MGPDWYVLGIDNGLTGYVCLLQTHSGAYKFIPTPGKVGSIAMDELNPSETETAAEYDVRSMHKIARAARQVSDGKCLAVIEKPLLSSETSGGTSRHSQESLIKGKSFWSAVCELEDIPIFCVAPRRWKASFSLLSQPKSASIALAEGMGVRLPTSVRGVKNDDAAESFLLAKWLATNSKVSEWE